MFLREENREKQKKKGEVTLTLDIPRGTKEYGS